MRLYFSLFFLLYLTSAISEAQEPCIDQTEHELLGLLNSERTAAGLKAVELSSSLSEVAALHAFDLMVNKPNNDECNPHSWSSEGSWKGCCYTSDHANPECMWNKPSELTSYDSPGYEIIAFQSSGSDPAARIAPEKALELWMKSKGHSAVILNQDGFSNIEWKAVGIAIDGNWACVWFGGEADESAPPSKCP